MKVIVDSRYNSQINNDIVYSFFVVEFSVHTKLTTFEMISHWVCEETRIVQRTDQINIDHIHTNLHRTTSQLSISFNFKSVFPKLPHNHRVKILLHTHTVNTSAATTDPRARRLNLSWFVIFSVVRARYKRIQNSLYSGLFFFLVQTISWAIRSVVIRTVAFAFLTHNNKLRYLACRQRQHTKRWTVREKEEEKYNMYNNTTNTTRKKKNRIKTQQTGRNFERIDAVDDVRFRLCLNSVPGRCFSFIIKKIIKRFFRLFFLERHNILMEFLFSLVYRISWCYFIFTYLWQSGTFFFFFMLMMIK